MFLATGLRSEVAAPRVSAGVQLARSIAVFRTAATKRGREDLV